MTERTKLVLILVAAYVASLGLLMLVVWLILGGS